MDIVKAAQVIYSLKSDDEHGECWWMSDVFRHIGYKGGARQMDTEVMKVFPLGVRQGCLDANDIVYTPIPTGARPRSDWRMTRRALYLLILVCNARGAEMDELRAAVAVLALG